MNTSNPYAPPRAAVGDVADPTAAAEPASRLIRLGAVIVDGLIIAALIYLPLFAGGSGWSLFGTDAQLDPSASAGVWVMLALAGLIIVAWLNILFVSRNGQSIAKKLMGIKVVRADGSKATLGRIFWIRNVVNGILNIVPLWWFVDSLVIFGERRQCLHDKIADTIVVRA